MTEKRWAELSIDEWLALVGIAHHPQSWGEAVQTNLRRDDVSAPRAGVLRKLRDLGLIDYVAPRSVDDFATCTLTELGRKTLDERNRRWARASGH